MSVRRLLLALLLLAGCAGDRERLAPDYAPLVWLQEGGALPAGLAEGDCRTVGDTVHVQELARWHEAHPDPVDVAAILAHEQVHAQRQVRAGTLAWVARYMAEREFALAEEKAGWEAQIRYLRGHGRVVNLAVVAHALGSYAGPWGQLISEADARAWAEGIR